MKRVFVAVAQLAVLFAAADAHAQIYVIQQQSQTYAPLSGTGVVTGTITSRGSFTADDEGYVDIPLGFSFPYYGQNYTYAHVDTNGFVMLHNGSPTVCRTGFTCYEGGKLPDTARTPHAVIAPYWADLSGNRPSSAIKYKIGSGEVDIEYVDWHDYTYSGGIPDYVFSARIKLTASGMFQIHYGTITGTSTTNTTTAGFENHDGTAGSSILGTANCYGTTPATCCSTTASSCNIANFPQNTLFTIGQPVQPDIAVPTVNISNLVQGSTTLSMTVTPTFRNFGQNPAGVFQWKAYLSTNRTYEVGDPEILTATTSAAIPGAGTLSPSASGSIATPSTGQYYVVVRADTLNAVTEALETNNDGATTNYFVQGLDLVATAVSGPALSGPTNNISVNVKWFNQGTDPAGTVSYRVLLSTDTSVSTNDFVLHSGTRNVTGGETVDENLSITVPNNVPGGDFYYLLQIDPLNSLTEASETNNAIASVAKVTMQQADLVNTGADFVDPITGATVRLGDFGSTCRVKVNINNAGGANANNFKVGVVVSEDANLSLLSDTLVHEQDVALVTPGQTLPVDFSFTMPLQNAASQPFVTGNYFLFVILDTRSAVTETNEANNNLGVTGTVRLRAPAPDLAVLRVDAPASAGAGELIPVYRVIKNVGNVDSAAIKYRYVASANTIITPDDVPLPIQGSGGATTDFGTVTLPVGASDSKTEIVRLPGTLTPGTWYVGVLADSDEQVVELDEVNNALASASVQVAGSSLVVATSQLPDAVVDRPYSFRLVAQGEQGASTWALDPAAGALPAGLTLAQDGLVSGTPTAPGVSAFTALVTNAGRQVAGRLVLRVLPTTSQVEVTTVSVPAVVNSPSIRYETVLGASGGVKPYTWRVKSGAFPGGISLAANGTVAGNPRSGLAEGTTPVTVEVRDSLGSTATRDFNVRVVAPGSIIFRNLTLPDGLVNVDYVTDVAVQNADNSTLARPLQFYVIGGALPEGLALSTQGDLAFIEGRPLAAGSFPFSLQVEDAKGRVATADFVLRIFPGRFRIVAQDMPEKMTPGQDANFRFTVSSTDVTFSIFSGALPPGLTLGADGKVTGQVATAGAIGVYNFVVEARDLTNATGLGAFTLEVAKDTRKGCSTTGAGGAWLLAALLPLLALRRRRALGALAAVALAALPGSALAQDYFVNGPTAATYAPLTGATKLGVTSYSGINVTLPFTFKFYGQATTSVGVAQHGYLYFAGDDGDSSNTGIPQTTAGSYDPTSFIAPWWDYAYLPSTGAGKEVRWKVDGTAPNRTATFEWANLATSSTAVTFSFQVVLFEGTNQIRFIYGATAPGGTVSASVGIQKQPTVGIAALSCTTASSGACAPTNFPVNQQIDFVQPPDLTLAGLGGDQTGYAGVPYRATLTLRNLGGSAATSAIVRYYVSSDAVLGSGDTAVGDAAPQNVAPLQDVLLNTNLTLPSALTQGTWFLLAQADPDSAILEQNETNNVATAFQFQIGAPTADLVVGSVTAPTASTPGAALAVNRTLTNSGNAAAAAFKYTVFLSDNSVVSLSDQVLLTGTVAGGLAANTSDTGVDNVTLPGNLSAGRYWVGVCVNYDPAATPAFGITEISQVNNCRTAPSAILVSSGQLAIVTASLPPGTQYAPYGVHLDAAGGDGQYSWSVSAGALPPGLTLSTSGDLTGTPAKAGAFSFDARVQSGTAEKTQTYSITVTDGSLPLAVVDQVPPAAEFGLAYATRLVAVGGKPPYVWALKADSARLPVGLALASDGLLEGRATETGEFTFSVEAEDSAGTKAAKELSIKVVAPSALQIATTRLAPGLLTKQYSALLQAVGGRSPYDWSLVRFQQLPENATEEPGPSLTAFPDNFGMRIEAGTQGERTLRGVPTQAGLFSMTLKVTDANGAEDQTTVLWRVSYEEGLAILTTMLPDGIAGQEYQAKLTTNAPTGTAGIAFGLACVKVATAVDKFECLGGSAPTLPAGLTLGTDGTLSGIPSIPPSGNATTYTFLVKATDSQGRQDVRGLSIKVRPDTLQSGGCSGTGLGPQALALLAALGLLPRRRRSA